MSCSYCKLGVKIPCLNDERFSFRISEKDHSLRAIAPNGTVIEVHANYCIVCGDKIEHETRGSMIENMIHNFNKQQERKTHDKRIDD